MKYTKDDIMKISYREDSSFMRQKLFISYSHEDKERGYGQNLDLKYR